MVCLSHDIGRYHITFLVVPSNVACDVTSPYTNTSSLTMGLRCAQIYTPIVGVKYPRPPNASHNDPHVYAC
jgi:hypothetical protein